MPGSVLRAMVAMPPPPAALPVRVGYRTRPVLGILIALLALVGITAEAVVLALYAKRTHLGVQAVALACASRAMAEVPPPGALPV